MDYNVEDYECNISVSNKLSAENHSEELTGHNLLLGKLSHTEDCPNETGRSSVQGKLL